MDSSVTQRKDALIRVRVTEAQRAQMIRTARHTGLDLSGWLRHVALQAIQRAKYTERARSKKGKRNG